MTIVGPGPDGIVRCNWANGAEIYRSYHDREWGRPVGDDRKVFEKLCLEGFQAGLSWITILRKREAFRAAFAGFDPFELCRFGETDVERLVSDPGIVRHRGKIVAAISNARTAVRLWEEGRSLAGMFWSHEPQTGPGRIAAGEANALPASTEESKALSAELRKAGFRFVGATTVYAAMQSLGVVNDHFPGCPILPEVDRDRASFVRPSIERAGGSRSD